MVENDDLHMTSRALSRRALLARLALVSGDLLFRAASSHAGPPPKETGLSSEGLLAGQAGFQPRTVAPLPHVDLPGFLSRAQLEAHHAEYARAVDRLKATEQSLAGMDRGAAEYANMRRTQVTAANDVLLHELYFRNLSPTPMRMPPYVERHLREHMGSQETWAADFTACAVAARTWAVLVYDPYDDRWHDTIMDSGDAGVWVGANPLVVCDVAEHAYRMDYQRREDYIAAFLSHIDWNEIAGRYRKVDRM